IKTLYQPGLGRNRTRRWQIQGSSHCLKQTSYQQSSTSVLSAICEDSVLFQSVSVQQTKSASEIRQHQESEGIEKTLVAVGPINLASFRTKAEPACRCTYP